MSLTREPTTSKDNPAKAYFDKLGDNVHILHLNFEKMPDKEKERVCEKIFIANVLDVRHCAKRSHIHSFISSYLIYSTVDSRLFLHG